MKRKILLLTVSILSTLCSAYSQYEPSVNLGNKTSYFTYSNTIRLSEHPDYYCYYYQFTISIAMDVRISHCESSVEATGIFLIDENGDYVDTSVGSKVCSNPNLADLVVSNLQPGTYWVYIDWTGTGNVVTTINGIRPQVTNPEGNTMANAIDAGTYSKKFEYTDTKNTSDFTNDYMNMSPYNDVFYRFTLSERMDVIIDHCGSAAPSTCFHLLDASGIFLAEGRGYQGIDACENNDQAYLSINLLPGTYYVVSEGQNQEVSTHIKGTPMNLGIGSTDRNFIVTRTYTSEEGTTWQDKIDYFDGLGRPEQSTMVKTCPNGSDLVTYQEYDGVGRESNNWLPTSVPSNNGSFVPLNVLRTHSGNSYPDESKPYACPVYESSPLKRVLEQYGPGQEWHDKSRSVRSGFLTNVADNDTLNCVHYKVNTTNNLTDTLVTIIHNGNYETAQLYVTRTSDEDGNAAFEFKDKLGQLVLTRQIVYNGTTKIFHDTYYIYDDYSNLVAVLPPLASDNMKSGTSWTNGNSTVLGNYAYLYMYDGRNRCKAKRLPGCSWNYYVYDMGDRLIFSQDGEQRKKGEWSFTLPDVFGRTCVTGICKNSFSALSATPPLNSVVVKAERDNTTGTYKGYTLSGVTLVSPTVLNVNYYDDYAFMGANGIPSSTDVNFGYEAASDFDTRYAESAKTLLTGTLTARLDGSTTPTYLYSVMYYDYRGRVIQTKSNNHLTGGIEKEYVAYNFTGQPTESKHIHSVTGKDTQTEIYSYAYDHAGRLLTTKHKLNTGTEVTLVENTYDELGRLKTNKKNNQSNLNTTYAYNVRSWMKSSNSPLFSQTLYYNDSYGSNTPRYNGNISAMSWTTSGDKTRGYKFAYDNLSRLTAAGYLEGGTANTSYGTSYAYDKHGNMTNLVRNGRTGTSTFGTIDNLSMSYAGNQLIKADDAGTNVSLSASMDFKNNSTAPKEYFYDSNGNLTKDLNKGIIGITYNLLNLPQSVSIANTLGQATNTYTYAADGRKLQAVIGSKRTDYVGNVIYEGGALKRILVDGGYIEGGAYYFYLTDHLGNNRVVANASGGIVQTNHYYPFGMSFAEGVTSSGQPYKYNGKELDTERGLNLYDYSARLMDPALGRFSTMDPKSEKYYSWSPYNYAFNNPLNVIDPNGCDGISVVDKESKTITINQTFYYNKNDNNFTSLAITQDRTISGGSMDGTTFTAETSLAAENGFGSQTWTITDGDGNEWSVSYQANFIGLEGDDAVTDALKNDPTANKMVYNESLSSAGTWNANDRTLSIGPNRRWFDESNRGGTTIHEMGHSWGLPHENAMSGSPIYGQSDNGKSSTATNGIMSYSGSREVKQNEVQYGANRIITTANGSKDNVVKIHVVGSQISQHIIIK